jgi:hypothetical protein
VYVKAQLEARNPTTNLLETSGSQVTSDTLYAFNIIRQHNDNQTLDAFLTASPRGLLNGTNGPIDIRDGEAFILSGIAHASQSRARFTLFKRDGTTENQNIIGAPVSLGTYADKRIFGFNVGPRAASAFFTLGYATHTGYSVFIADSGNNALTDTLTFSLVEKCQALDLRLQWLNSKGGADGFTFNAVKRTGTAVKSDRSEKPLTFGFASFDHNQRGLYRTNVQVEDFWEVETRVIDESTAEWVAGLFTSPEAYIEQQGSEVYIPAIVSDAKIVYADSNEVGVIMKAVITKANQKMTQRY